MKKLLAILLLAGVMTSVITAPGYAQEDRGQWDHNNPHPQHSVQQHPAGAHPDFHHNGAPPVVRHEPNHFVDHRFVDCRVVVDRRFEDHRFYGWSGGHWWHGPHAARSGWWWVYGPNFYGYPEPVYPYPVVYQQPVIVAPPPVPVQAQPQYYCEDPNGYYPDVSECYTGWEEVQPQPVQ